MIYHLLLQREWQEALNRGLYQPASLAVEGFVHCSTLEQVAETARRFFAGQAGLVLLHIDESRLTARLEWESPANPHDPRANQRFPHVYGPINLEAVVEVRKFTSEFNF